MNRYLPIHIIKRKCLKKDIYKDEEFDDDDEDEVLSKPITLSKHG